VQAISSCSELVDHHDGLKGRAAHQSVEIRARSKLVLQVRNYPIIPTPVVMKTLPEAILEYANGSGGPRVNLERRRWTANHQPKVSQIQPMGTAYLQPAQQDRQ
jgi:hypothetical protein